MATCMSLGFARDRVVLALGVANGSIDVAIEWLLARAEADDRAVASGATRSAQPSSSSSSSKVAPAMQPGSAEDQDEDDEAVAMIVSFGFSVPPARAALRECDGDTARAIQLLADRSDALPDATAASASTAGLGGGQQHAEDDYLCFGDQVRLTLQRHLALPCGATAGSGSGSGSGSKQPAAPRSSLNSAAPRARLGDLRGATAVFRLVHPDPRQRSHSRDGGLHRSPHDDTSSEMGPTATAVRHLSEVLLQCARVRPAKSASALLTPPRPVASSSVAAASKRNASHAGSSAVGNDDDENSLVDEDEFDACFLAMEGDGSVSCNRGGVADFFMKWRVRASGQVDDEDGTGGDDQSSQRQRPLPRALRNGDQCHFLSSLHSMLGVNPQGIVHSLIARHCD